MNINVLCVAARNRECGWLCVGVRGSGWLHHEGAREEGGRRGARSEVSAILSNGDGLLFGVGIILL